MLAKTVDTGGMVLLFVGLLGLGLFGVLVRILSIEGPMTAGKIALGVFVGILAAAAVIAVGLIALGAVASLL